MPSFIFITCQLGAEKAVKDELARRWPTMRFAFSRPGFLTFKTPPDRYLAPDFDLESVFARAYGFSLGKVTGQSEEQLAAAAWKLYGDRPCERIHAWQRDLAEPGERGYEPGITPAAVAAWEALRRTWPGKRRLPAAWQEPARPGAWILDCIRIDPGQWWIGFHRAQAVPSRWPGGMLPLELPPQAVSRAWLKMEEALRWSQLPMTKGARCAELGSAPGGASQALLDRGLEVLGIDPAEMDPGVLARPGFRHIRRRALEVPRRDFRKIRWLTADMNVAPEYTLDAVEAIVTHAEVHVRGMLLTLKLPDWKLAASLPDYLGRVRGWGYNIVRARQLQHNRREVCVAALQKPFRRNAPR
jgi:23S rRNA (cytidine2498-2'-O)-methyltransferase